MKNKRGYVTVDLESLKEFKPGSIERELLIELSCRENSERLNNRLPKGHFYINQIELSKALNVSQMTISRSLKKLIKNGSVTDVLKSLKRCLPSIYGLICVIQQEEMFKVVPQNDEKPKKEPKPIKTTVSYIKLRDKKQAEKDTEKTVK